MTTLRHWLFRLRALFRRDEIERGFDEELRYHFDREVERNVARGMSPEAARYAARRAFGNPTALTEEARETWRWRGAEDLAQDVRYAVRTLRRDAGLAVGGALTLALGIGATTAVFSAVNAVMLRDLPFREPDRLVAVWEENPDRGWHKNVVAPANYLDWREQVSAFDGMAAYTDYQTNVTLLGRGEPQLLSATYVTGNFQRVLGVQPQLGRGLEDADDWDDGRRSILISHHVWTTRFRGDSSVIGTSVALGGGRPWQIVGVMPEGFAFPAPSTDVWIPVLWARGNRGEVWFRRAHWLRVVARMRPAVSEAEANAALQVVVRRLQAEYPATNARMGAGITPLHEWVVGDTKRPLIVLLAAAGVLLLIACANVGNLLLVHALGRSRDVALRYAIGATRGRVARQALTQSLVLACAGGVLGLAFGWLGARVLLAMQPPAMLPVTDIGLDYRVLAFATCLVALSAALFGTAPSWTATRLAPAEALGSGGRTSTGGGTRRWGRHLVVVEIALAVVLTVGAGLLLRSYERLVHVQPGFDPDGVLTASVSVPGSRYDSAAKVIGFYSSLVERVKAIPGVDRAGAVRALPLTGPSWSSSLAIDGRPPMAEGQDVLHREVLGDYFQVMRVPLLRGRLMAASDAQGAPLVVVVNDALAKGYFPGEDPIGRRVTFDRVPDSTSLWRTIVGVVGNERQTGLASPARPEIFAPFEQDPGPGMVIVARTRPGLNPASVSGAVRAAVRDLDSLLALNALEPMTDVHSRAVARERFTSALVLAFAATGVVLALVGVFGILAQLVQSRWRELGIRLALGAQRAQVRWLVVRYGLTLLAVGVPAGLLVALWATRVLDSLLYGIEPHDALTYVVASLVIVGAGLIAAWIPAWRASAASPATTLRAQ